MRSHMETQHPDVPHENWGDPDFQYKPRRPQTVLQGTDSMPLIPLSGSPFFFANDIGFIAL